MDNQYSWGSFIGQPPDSALYVDVGQHLDYGYPYEGNVQLHDIKGAANHAFPTPISVGGLSDRATAEARDAYVHGDGSAGGTTCSSVARDESSYGQQTQDAIHSHAVESLNKRRAQNRASQQAFRARKERHNAELNQKIDQLQNNMSGLRDENEQLQQQIAEMISQNRVRTEARTRQPTSEQKNPMTFSWSSERFFDSTVPDGHEKRPVYRLTVDKNTGEKLLDIGATWDLIQQHAYFKMGILDLVKVCEYLRRHIQCDGQGPVFGERFIFDAIESGLVGDNLI
ncbi:hypothetical protein ASPVEDRAFT_24925 [Aspergillus versicolor CBS 583.65]|uniref:BZIP domain-containing protein n=1 Tax=Aspergillus versicolor CBS 583.65 TaxID=1036611 RepID=A0A1L9P914_ASPVE|nr:uncharacterized protein ASPVEDRAFT_24925 [Aspergillus versicolor CBS 583.65]OJI98017.1 hypothetical protein ASPVEDRAFT_24925 [Aspergillus versicolor CBS 583.65]